MRRASRLFFAHERSHHPPRTLARRSPFPSRPPSLHHLFSRRPFLQCAATRQYVSLRRHSSTSCALSPRPACEEDRKGCAPAPASMAGRLPRFLPARAPLAAEQAASRHRAGSLSVAGDATTWRRRLSSGCLVAGLVRSALLFLWPALRLPAHLDRGPLQASDGGGAQSEQRSAPAQSRAASFPALRDSLSPSCYSRALEEAATGAERRALGLLNRDAPTPSPPTYTDTRSHPSPCSDAPP